MLKQLIYVNLHPFDGFYQTSRSEKKGKYLVATVLLVIYGILQIIAYQYTGFIMNYQPIFMMNSIRIFLLALLPIVLFVVSNWSITTILEGSGSIGDIYIVVCYSLFPKIVFDLIGVIVSNFIISEEIPILQAFMAIGTVWFCFLIFAGLCVVHEYTVFTNIIMIILTFLIILTILMILIITTILMLLLIVIQVIQLVKVLTIISK